MSEIRTRTRGSTLTTWPLLKIKFCYWYYWMKLLWFRANSRAQWLWLCHPSFSLGFIFQAYHSCFFKIYMICYVAGTFICHLKLCNKTIKMDWSTSGHFEIVISYEHIKVDCPVSVQLIPCHWQFLWSYWLRYV